MNKPGKIIVVGASSGIGQRIAEHYAAEGWMTGVCARREEPLRSMAEQFGGRVSYRILDVTAPDSARSFRDFVDSMGGVDVVVYAAGCGWNNPDLDTAKDERTVDTNVVGFTRIINTAFDIFKTRGASTMARGQIAAITSIAGAKGIGISATYSATKRYQWTYLESLAQLARIQDVSVDITDIRPGFIDTPLLDTATRRYPMLMSLDHAVPLILKAIRRRRHVAVIDRRWAVVTALWRRIPRFIWRRLKLSF